MHPRPREGIVARLSCKFLCTGFDMSGAGSFAEMGVHRSMRGEPHGGSRAVCVRDEMWSSPAATQHHRQVGGNESRQVPEGDDAGPNLSACGPSIDCSVEITHRSIIDDRAAPGFEVASHIIIVSDHEHFQDARAGTERGNSVECHGACQPWESEPRLP